MSELAGAALVGLMFLILATTPRRRTVFTHTRPAGPNPFRVNASGLRDTPYGRDPHGLRPHPFDPAPPLGGLESGSNYPLPPRPFYTLDRPADPDPYAQAVTDTTTPPAFFDREFRA